MTRAALTDPRTGTTPATMLAGRITAPGVASAEEIAVPEPGHGQVRVRVEACGVCGSNIPVWEGREWFTYPLEHGNPGHEGCGVVDALGEGVSDLKVGDRVAFLSSHAFAQYDIADASAAVRIPALLADAYILGEPMACAVNVFRRSGIQRGDRVAIVGIGFLGGLITQLAADAGAEVIAITRRPFALEIAKRMGADHTIPMDDHARIIDDVRRITGGAMCDVVVEAIGMQWPLDLAAELTKERGRLVIAGFHQDGSRQVNMQMWNWRGLDVINAHERDPAVYTEGMRLAVGLVAAGRLDPSPLLTHTFPLDRLADALECARTRPDGFLKAVVTMPIPPGRRPASETEHRA